MPQFFGLRHHPQIHFLYFDACISIIYLIVSGLVTDYANRKVLLKLIGDVLKDSEWTQILAQAYAFSSGVAEKLLSASHIKKTPRSHQITLAALHIVF